MRCLLKSKSLFATYVTRAHPGRPRGRPQQPPNDAQAAAAGPQTAGLSPLKALQTAATNFSSVMSSSMMLTPSTVTHGTHLWSFGVAAAASTWYFSPSSPFAQVDIPVIGQVYLLYRASLEEGSRFGAGPETLESKFLPLDEVPYDDLAFSSVVTALRFFAADVEAGSFGFHSCVIDKDPGSSPSDPASYRVTQASRVPPLPYPALGGGG